MTDDTRRMASIRILTGGRDSTERNEPMPTDNIDTMSGPELSAAVAVEVMGWELWEGCQWIQANGDCWGDVDDWNPHEDRNDAYRVIQEIERRHLLDDLCWWLRNRIGATQAETLLCNPAIICRAALRAVREARG